MGFAVEGTKNPIWTVVSTKGGSITLFKKTGPVPCAYAEDESPFNFHVRNFEEAATALESKGYRMNRHGAHNGYLTDPWGNILWLHDHREESR